MTRLAKLIFAAACTVLVTQPSVGETQDQFCQKSSDGNSLEIHLSNPLDKAISCSADCVFADNESAEVQCKTENNVELPAKSTDVVIDRCNSGGRALLQLVEKNITCN